MSAKITTLFAAAAALCSAAMAQETAAPAAEQVMAKVRFIHAVPNAPAVGVSIGTDNVFSSVTYKQVTEPESVPSRTDQDKERKVVLMPAAGGAPIESQREHDFDDSDEDYTILASPKREGDGVEITVFKLDRLESGAKEAQVTLVNAVPDVRALDLFVDQKKVHAGVNYTGHNGPDKIESGPHTLSVKTADDQVVMQPTMVNMRPGQSYTVVAMGSMAGGLEAVVVEDALGATGSPGASAASAGTTTTMSSEAMTTSPM